MPSTVRSNHAIIKMALFDNTIGNNWIEEVDYWRGIAIVAVVTIHCTGRLWWYPYLNEPNMLAHITTLIYSCAQFAVPLFIFTSGFALSVRYQMAYSMKSYFLTRVIRIIPPYIIFSLLYICFYILIGDSTLNIKKSLTELFVADASFHLWFIAIIIQFYLLYPMLIRIYNYYSKNIYYLLSITLVIQIFSPKIINALLSKVLSNYFTDIITSKILYIFDTRIFISYLFYFMLGIHCSRNYEIFSDAIKKIRLNQVVFAALTIMILSSLYSFLWINEIYKLYSINMYLEVALFSMSSTVMNLVAFAVVFKISYLLISRNSTLQYILNNLGKYAFGIFLIHIIFIRIIADGLQLVGVRGDNWQFYPVLFVGTIVSSVVSVYAINKWEYGYYLIGVVHK